VTSYILEKARLLGASLAGVANVASLRNAPSYRVYGTTELPAEARSVLVLALAHREAEPELDWWGIPEGTPGNRTLKTISQGLKQWLNEEYNIPAQPLPYQVERGGIFLKDAAVLAGLGIIGRNNLLITPEFGPRVRLRALFLDVDVTPTGSITFSPCDTCDMPCRLNCPRNAFASGSYNRNDCAKQMQEDEAKVLIEKAVQEDSPAVQIKYCRACELACPVGK
jgi:epoxyqueuosine reductase